MRLTLLLLTSLAAGLPAAAIAQRENDPIRQAADCATANDRGRSAELARAIPGGEQEQGAVAALDPVRRRCFAAAGLVDSPDARALFAGAVAEALYLRTITSLRIGPAGGAGEAPAPAVLAQATANRTQGWPAEAAAAECLVAIAPNDVDRLLRAPRRSAASADLLGQLVPMLSTCLPQGVQLSIGPSRLRAELARALYRLVNMMAAPLMPGAARRARD